MNYKNFARTSLLALTASMLFAAGEAQATPSTQIWIPSTDVQPFVVPHLNYDVYARPSKTPVLWLGPTMGILPFKKIQAEVGFDLVFQGIHALDRYPLYFNAKLGTPEDAWFTGSPALAVGAYNLGIKPGLTTQNLGYALIARTLPIVGRLSGGYYVGNELVLLDANNQHANRGLLLSWDRAMKEISDKLWFGVDYQGGRSALGALNAGFSWAFTPATSVLVGYDAYLDKAVAGLNTFTIQLDINMQ